MSSSSSLFNKTKAHVQPGACLSSSSMTGEGGLSFGSIVRCVLEPSQCANLSFESSENISYLSGQQLSHLNVTECQDKVQDVVIGRCTSSSDNNACTGHSSNCKIPSSFESSGISNFSAGSSANQPSCNVRYNLHYENFDGLDPISPFALYGKCVSRDSSHCVWSTDDCPEIGDIHQYIPSADQPTLEISLDEQCTCDRTLVGACHNVQLDIYTCAVSEDACGEEEDSNIVFVDAMTLYNRHHPAPECYLCPPFDLTEPRPQVLPTTPPALAPTGISTVPEPWTLACPPVPPTGCSLCGLNRCVTLPETTTHLPWDSEPKTCKELQTKASNGGYTDGECLFMPEQLAVEICGCALSGTTITPQPTMPTPTITELPSPTLQPVMPFSTPLLYCLSVPSGGCSPCGINKCITKPHALFQLPWESKPQTCEQIQTRGHNGDFTDGQCLFMPDETTLRETCGCDLSGSTVTPQPSMPIPNSEFPLPIPSQFLVCPPVPTGGCSPCGVNKCITKPDVLVRLEWESTRQSCEHLQSKAYAGGYTDGQCMFMPEELTIVDACGCALSGTTITPQTPTPNPTTEAPFPTLKPVMPLPTPLPTLPLFSTRPNTPTKPTLQPTLDPLPASPPTPVPFLFTPLPTQTPTPALIGVEELPTVSTQTPPPTYYPTSLSIINYGPQPTSPVITDNTETDNTTAVVAGVLVSTVVTILFAIVMVVRLSNRRLQNLAANAEEVQQFRMRGAKSELL